jgi:hypothetical protein
LTASVVLSVFAVVRWAMVDMKCQERAPDRA